MLGKGEVLKCVNSMWDILDSECHVSSGFWEEEDSHIELLHLYMQRKQVAATAFDFNRFTRAHPARAWRGGALF